MTQALARVTTLVFDVMGTVVDVDGAIERAAERALTPLGVNDAERSAFVADERERLQRMMDDVIAADVPWRGHEALRRAAVDEAAVAAGLGRLPNDARAGMASVIHQCDPWPDSAAALGRLRARYAVLALSNADFAELVDLSRAGGLAWHGVLSTAAFRSFKPDPAVYRAAIDLSGADAERILMVAAHPWDLRAAAEHGLRTAFVARPAADAPRADDEFDLTVIDLHDLADRLLG